MIYEGGNFLLPHEIFPTNLDIVYNFFDKKKKRENVLLLYVYVYIYNISVYIYISGCVKNASTFSLKKVLQNARKINPIENFSRTH